MQVGPAGGTLPAIEAQELGWRAGGRWVLRRLNLGVPVGMLLGVTGSNGAGKSALLRLIAALAAPTEGWVRVLGYHIPRQAAAVRRQVGYLPQRGGVYERLTIAQNLDFVARAHGLGAETRAEVVRTLLEVVGLSDQAGTLAGSLSPGQRRRAALAAALAHDPPVLLLDDPLRGLDGLARLEHGEVLRELHGMGKTVVVATNLLADLASLCDEIAVLRAGSLLWRGPPSQLPPPETMEDGRPTDVSTFDRMLAALLQDSESVASLPVDGG